MKVFEIQSFTRKMKFKLGDRKQLELSLQEKKEAKTGIVSSTGEIEKALSRSEATTGLEAGSESEAEVLESEESRSGSEASSGRDSSSVVFG